MGDILKTLFLDNPYLEEQVHAFCQQSPEFQAARRAYEAQLDRAEERLGFEAVDELEDAVIRYLSQCAHVYYLFGLGLRQEVLSALGQMG